MFDYKETIKKLNKHTELYDLGTPAISDKEWDDLYFQIVEYEKTHKADKDSPTQKIHSNALNKVQHSTPMLSLKKTKDIEEVKKFFKDKDIIAMAKLDGLTCRLTYKDGKLFRAETRGNGLIGEDVTHNAMMIDNIPKELSEDIVVEGEVICKYSDYKGSSNVRNYAAGSMRLKVAEQRNLSFIAFDLISSNDFSLLSEKLYELGKNFEVVPHRFDFDTEALREQCADLPIDGLVYKVNDIEEYEDAGRTEHSPNAALAFKFYDELYETKLLDIVWTQGKTGNLTPVAKFEPVVIDGTVVQNASMHNYELVEKLLQKPSVGQTVYVYKSNMIIPQIHHAGAPTDEEIKLPEICPDCGTPLQIDIKGVKQLMCNNKKCPAKIKNKLVNFAGKQALDIESLSISTVDKLIQLGWLTCLSDYFKLYTHREEWLNLNGFSEISVDKILNNIPKEIELWKLIASCGLENISKQTAIQLVDYFKTYEAFRKAVDEKFDFCSLKNIGITTANTIANFDYSELDDVMNYIEVAQLNKKSASVKVCLTGKMSKSRKEIVKFLEEHNAEETAIQKADFLVCNEPSNSSKYKKAVELGKQIITEKELYDMFS